MFVIFFCAYLMCSHLFRFPLINLMMKSGTRHHNPRSHRAQMLFGDDIGVYMCCTHSLHLLFGELRQMGHSTTDGTRFSDFLHDHLRF